MSVTYIEEPDAAPRHAFVVGGCHVTGVGIGENPPFWRVATRWWNANQVESFAHLTIPKACDVLQCRIVFPLNSLFILQLGHFDAGRVFSKINPIRKKNKSVSKRNKTQTVNKSDKPIFRKSVIYLSFKFMEGVAGWIFDRLAINEKEINEGKQKISEEFNKLAKVLERDPPKTVVVLSTFPTMSLRLNRNRSMLNGIMEDLAKKHNFVYVDVWRELRSGLFGMDFPARSILLDSLHLNAKGHDIVGRAIIEKLRQSIP